MYDEQIREFAIRKETLEIIKCLEEALPFFKLFANTQEVKNFVFDQLECLKKGMAENLEEIAKLEISQKEPKEIEKSFKEIQAFNRLL
jgi:hypothetical protein